MKAKKRIISLAIILFIFILALGAWLLSSHLNNKNQKTAQKTEIQTQQSSETPNPSIQGTATISPQAETASTAQNNNSSKGSSQHTNQIPSISPDVSNLPTYGPLPDNYWCESYKEQQRQTLASLYQIKIDEENQRYQQEVAEINADFARRGMWDSGAHWEALRQAESAHNTALSWLDYRYQEDLRKIDYLC